jgi:hypothetical protein
MPAAALLVAVAYVPGIYSAASMPRWWVMALALPVISDLDPRQLWAPVGVCLFGGLMWAAVSLAVSPDPQNGALQLLLMALLALTMIAAAGIEDVDRCVEWFGWGIAISCVLAVPQWFGWNGILQTARPAGLFLNSEILAETAAPILIWAWFKNRFALFGVMLIPLLLCHSRIAVVVAAAGLLYGWRPRHWGLRPLLIALLANAALASVFVLGFGKLESGLDRMVLWGAGLLSITPGGRGLGWWASTHPGPLSEVAHSDALQLMVEVGLGSLFLLAVPIILLTRGTGDTAMRAAYVALGVEALVSFPMHLAASGFLAAVLAGHMARARADIRDARLESRAGVLASVRQAAARAVGMDYGSGRNAGVVSMGSPAASFGTRDEGAGVAMMLLRK